jgi:hypothetical protein
MCGMSNEQFSEMADDLIGSDRHPSPADRRTVAPASYASSAAFGALGGAVAGVVVGVIAGPEGILAGALFGGVVGAAAAAAVGMDQRERRLLEELRDQAPLLFDEEHEETEKCAVEEALLAFPESFEPALVPATVSLSATERYGGWSGDRTASR